MENGKGQHKMKDKVSIVILNYDRYDLVHQLLFDIYKNCTRPDEVLVVNNGCTQEESFTGLEWWMKAGHLPVRELRIDENIGFLLGANEGLKEATGDIIILISNDVRVMGDIILRIQNIINGTSDVLIGGRVLDWDTGWNKFDKELFPYVEGWLLAAHRESWIELGYFDERYAPNDYEDLDISTTARDKGYELVALPEDITVHQSAQTIGYNAKREALTKINREKFKDKWLK